MWPRRQTQEAYSSRRGPSHWSSVRPSLRGRPSLAMTRWSPVLPCQGWPRDPWTRVPPPNVPPCPGATPSEDLSLFWVHTGDRARVFLPLGVPPLTQSPRLADQVQPPPVRARFRALGENPRLPWPVNHFNAFLKPERINRPPASGTQYGRPRGPACPLGGGAEKGKMALAPLGLARMQITTTKITLPHTSVRLPES